jgi:hypothetical protein
MKATLNSAFRARSRGKPSALDAEINRPNSNAKREQADQARPHRRQPRLISRYVGTRKPTRRRATCLTIQRSALAPLSCA